MSTTAPISIDEFQALEQKVLRAIEIVKQEREARAAAEAEAASLRQQLAEKTNTVADTAAALLSLERDREEIRRRVEKMAAQIDELL